MHQSSDFPKPTHCYGCNVKFENSQSLEAHRKRDCPKWLKSPSSYTVTTEEINNLSDSSSQVQFLENRNTKTWLEAVSPAINRKQSAFEAFVKVAKDFQRVENSYIASVRQSTQACSNYNKVLKWKKVSFTTICTETGLFAFEKAVPNFSQVEIALKNEQDIEIVLRQTIEKHIAAYDAFVEAVTLEEATFTETVKDLREQGNKNGEDQTYEEHEILSHIERTLKESKTMLATIRNTATNQVASAIFVAERASVRTLDLMDENSVASTSGTRQIMSPPDFLIFRK